MKYFLITLLLITIFLPLAASAAPLINIWDGTSGGGCNIPVTDSDHNLTNACTFCDALVVIRNIISLLFEIAVPLAVLMIVWGAVRLMLAGGSEKNFGEGKTIMTNAVTGLVIALAAWLIVNSILNILVTGAGGITWPWNQISCS